MYVWVGRVVAMTKRKYFGNTRWWCWDWHRWIHNLSQADHCKNRDLFSSFERSVRPNARFYSEFLSGCLCDKSHGYLF